MAHTIAIERQIDRGTRTIDGTIVTITEHRTAHGRPTFTAHRTDNRPIADHAFDAVPSDDQIRHLIAATVDRWICPGCAANVAAADTDLIDDHRRDCSPAADAAIVRDHFAVYRCLPESVWHIAGDDTEPAMRIGVSALGGGTVGRTYTFTTWIYGLWLNGHLRHCGSDVRSGGIPTTHHQIAVLAGERLLDDLTSDRTRQRLNHWLDAQAVSDNG